MPASIVDEDMFTDGKMFDGSSIAGWKGINESDMVLMPDPTTAVLDPFSDETSLILSCDILEPNTMQGYERDPRSVAKRAEAYLKSTGIADTAFFGPEPEFFIFDDVRWGADISGCFYKVDSQEADWNSERVYQDGNMGHRPGVKGGYFPVPPVDSLTTSVRPCASRWRRWASRSRCTTTRSPRPASARSAPSSTPWCAAPTRP